VRDDGVAVALQARPCGRGGIDQLPDLGDLEEVVATSDRAEAVGEVAAGDGAARVVVGEGGELLQPRGQAVVELRPPGESREALTPGQGKGLRVARDHRRVRLVA